MIIPELRKLHQSGTLRCNSMHRSPAYRAGQAVRIMSSQPKHSEQSSCIHNAHPAELSPKHWKTRTLSKYEYSKKTENRKLKSIDTASSFLEKEFWASKEGILDRFEPSVILRSSLIQRETSPLYKGTYFQNDEIKKNKKALGKCIRLKHFPVRAFINMVNYQFLICINNSIVEERG